ERLPRALAEVFRLLCIEIVETVAVHILLPAREILRLKRGAVVGKRGRLAGVGQEFFRRPTPRSAELEEESNDVAALPGRHGLRQAVWHQCANVSSFLDVGLGKVDQVSRRRVFEDELLVAFTFLVARVYLPSTSHHGNGHVPFLDLPLGPKDRFDNLIRRQAAADQREIRTDASALRSNFVASQAGKLRRPEDLRAAPGISVCLCLGQQPYHQLAVVWQLLGCTVGLFGTRRLRRRRNRRAWFGRRSRGLAVELGEKLASVIAADL